MTWLVRISLAALVSATACQNNTIELETDPVSQTSGDSSGGGGSTTSSVPTTETMLLAIHTIWSDTAFLQGLMTSTPSGSTTAITVQFLSLDAGSNTSPRMPVGMEYSYPAVPLDGDGGFVLDMGQITIVAAANSINGLDINTSMILDARPDGSPYCGDVTGSVTAPVVAEFAGSTHAMTAVPSASELPTSVVASCP